MDYMTKLLDEVAEPPIPQEIWDIQREVLLGGYPEAHRLEWGIKDGQPAMAWMSKWDGEWYGSYMRKGDSPDLRWATETPKIMLQQAQMTLEKLHAAEDVNGLSG